MAGRSESGWGVRKALKSIKGYGKGEAEKGTVQGCKYVVPRRWAVEHNYIPE